MLCTFQPSSLLLDIGDLALKAAARIHLKMPSAQVVCCMFLLTLFDYCKYGGIQCGPRSDSSLRSSLVWVHLVCQKATETFQQTTKAEGTSKRLFTCATLIKRFWTFCTFHFGRLWLKNIMYSNTPRL